MTTGRGLREVVSNYIKTTFLTSLKDCGAKAKVRAISTDMSPLRLESRSLPLGGV